MNLPAEYLLVYTISLHENYNNRWQMKLDAINQIICSPKPVFFSLIKVRI